MCKISLFNVRLFRIQVLYDLQKVKRELRSERTKSGNWYHFACVHHQQLHLEQLKLATCSNARNRANASPSTVTITTPRNVPETHAYRIPHVGVTNTQIHKSVVTADNISARDDIPIAAEKKKSIDKRCDGTDFGSSRCVDDWRDVPLDARDEEYLDDRKTENCNQRTTIVNETARILSNDHIYEEVRAIKEPRDSSYEYDIRDYYEKYSSATAKTLIDTLFLPRHAICRECARTKGSPVYTDRLIYTKESLLAIEVILRQRDDVSCFEYSREDSEDSFCPQYDRSRDYMLVYSYAKTNVAGIFYFHCWPRDIFDLQSLLRPSIQVVNHARCNLAVNTELYHRRINNYHVRTSRTGCTPMIFYHDCRTLISCTTPISRNDSSDPLYQMHRSRDDDIVNRGNRSSLLLLEPLLRMPESVDSENRGNIKNRLSQSERVKISRIIMAYVSSFLILASITFYIVYFT